MRQHIMMTYLRLRAANCSSYDGAAPVISTGSESLAGTVTAPPPPSIVPLAWFIRQRGDASGSTRSLGGPGGLAPRLGFGAWPQKTQRGDDQGLDAGPQGRV